jgi:guanylate kinase
VSVVPHRQPLLIIVSGPSGSGKSTLVQKILELPRTLFSISCTTRPPRKTETSGQWYDFISEERFQHMVDCGDFLEYAQVFGRSWYGTPKRWLEEARAQGADLVLEIDVQGASQVKQQVASAISIFILPPSWKELEGRIRGRGQDSEEEIDRRLIRARQELQRFGEYEYAVVNDDLERAGREVQAVVLASRCQVNRHRGGFQDIVNQIGG